MSEEGVIPRHLSQNPLVSNPFHQAQQYASSTGTLGPEGRGSTGPLCAPVPAADDDDGAADEQINQSTCSAMVFQGAAQAQIGGVRRGMEPPVETRVFYFFRSCESQ